MWAPLKSVHSTRICMTLTVSGHTQVGLCLITGEEAGSMYDH